MLVYVSGYIFLLFGAVCLASGLYWLVELAEEYTSLAKKLIRGATITLLVLHVLLLVYERFPLLPTGTGLASHAVYYQLLRSFPFVEPRSALFGISAVGFVASNIMWYRFFAADVEIFYRYGVAPLPAVAAFFLLVVWLVPGAFFVSLTVNEAVLPGAGVDSLRGVSPASSGARGDDGGGDRKRRKNVVLAGFGWAVDAVRRAAGYESRERTDLFSSAPGRRAQHDCPMLQYMCVCRSAKGASKRGTCTACRSCDGAKGGVTSRARGDAASCARGGLATSRSVEQKSKFIISFKTHHKDRQTAQK